MTDQLTALRAAFSGLHRYHIATPHTPLPDDAPGICWIFAANGVFKQGANAHLVARVCAEPFAAPIPGLAELTPAVRWRDWPDAHLPGAALLPPVLEQAQATVSPLGANLGRPIELQLFVVLRDGMARLIKPNQISTATWLRYRMPDGVLLCDLHSHHAMPAFFSGTDDGDDQGLGVSAVIGGIFTGPEIRTRINVYGVSQEVPATLVFDDLGPFAQGGLGDAVTHD
ncbi:MAG TPA: Mov34/MPN/PAD-1 family protein [Roseiflexaceae bacterium]|nr:Mov34/MPN/PAD-1 family protein [Roseiflexaceae bacterium]